MKFHYGYLFAALGQVAAVHMDMDPNEHNDESRVIISRLRKNMFFNSILFVVWLIEVPQRQGTQGPSRTPIADPSATTRTATVFSNSHSKL